MRNIRLFVFATVCAVALVQPTMAIEFQEGATMELYRKLTNTNRGTMGEVCVYSYNGVDEAGHLWTAESESDCRLKRFWLDRETGEVVGWHTDSLFRRYLSRDGDRLFRSGGPGEEWKLSYMSSWVDGQGRTRTGRSRGKCSASEIEGGNYTYTVKCKHKLVGDGIAWRYTISVDAKTDMWAKLTGRSTRGMSFIWEIRQMPTITQPAQLPSLEVTKATEVKKVQAKKNVDR